MFFYNLKTAFRFFIRNKSITLINFFGMSIGFASIIIISNWVFYEFSFDAFHEKKDRIYRVIEKQSFKGQNEKYLSSMPEWLIGTFEKEIPGVEASTGLFRVGQTDEGGARFTVLLPIDIGVNETPVDAEVKAVNSRVML